jgi:hypothetical protein
MDKLRLSLTNSEQQCNLLRLELQRVQTEKEILKVRLIEQKMTESPTTDFKYLFLNFVFFTKHYSTREIDNTDYEKFIRNELETNIDQANKLIKYFLIEQNKR